MTDFRKQNTPATSDQNNFSDLDNLRKGAYKTDKKLNQRKALYAHVQPHYDAETEAFKLLTLDARQSLLDVGCGAGTLLLMLANAYPSAQLAGLDISPEMYRLAALNAKQFGYPITFFPGDIQEMPFKADSFDVVTAVHVLYHTASIPKAVEEIVRVLKPDGKVVVTVNTLANKPVMRLLKQEVAKKLGTNQYPDAALRLNIENGREILDKYFGSITEKLFRSQVILHDAEPYVSYFDSTRDFWDPVPTNEQWKEVLILVRDYIDNIIQTEGIFQEINEFGALIAQDKR